MSLTETPQRRGYHLGDVRARLCAAARQMLDEEGQGRLSLRAIAARTGVAPATVYYHFADKQALLAELAVEGFGELAGLMRERLEAQGGGGGAVWRAYLEFLTRKPALYELMYAARDEGRRVEVVQAEADAFEVLIEAIRRGGCGGSGPDTLRQRAVAMWACGRGAAALALAQREAGSGAAFGLVEDCAQGMTALLTAR